MTALKIIKLDETKKLICFAEGLTGKRICMMKDDFNSALNKFKVWRQDVYSNCFSSQLFMLFCKADDTNKINFLAGFPAEMIVYLLWYTSASEDEFYKEWGNIKNKEPKNMEKGEEDERA